MTPKKRAQDMSDMSQVQLSFFLCLFYFTNYITVTDTQSLQNGWGLNKKFLCNFDFRFGLGLIDNIQIQ